jgi:hypothetical protein
MQALVALRRAPAESSQEGGIMDSKKYWPLFCLSSAVAALFGGAVLLAQPQQVKKQASEYIDAAYGYRLTPPSYGVSREPMVMTAVFFAPPKNGFAANINVQVQRPGVSWEEFQTLSARQLEASGFEVSSREPRKVGENRAVEWLYSGELQGRRMRFIGLAIEKGEQVFLLTATALESSFAEHEKAFREALSSFRFDA